MMMSSSRRMSRQASSSSSGATEPDLPMKDGGSDRSYLRCLVLSAGSCPFLLMKFFSFSYRHSWNCLLHFFSLVQRFFLHPDRNCSVYPATANQKVLAVSDEDELLV